MAHYSNYEDTMDNMSIFFLKPQLLRTLIFIHLFIY